MTKKKDLDSEKLAEDTEKLAADQAAGNTEEIAKDEAAIEADKSDLAADELTPEDEIIVPAWEPRDDDAGDPSKLDVQAEMRSFAGLLQEITDRCIKIENSFNRANQQNPMIVKAMYNNCKTALSRLTIPNDQYKLL
jgi:hypothetical protein